MSTSLKQDIYNLNTSSVLTTDVESSEVKHSLPSKVEYVYLY
jgi:hypothetical protein